MGRPQTRCGLWVKRNFPDPAGTRTPDHPAPNNVNKSGSNTVDYSVPFHSTLFEEVPRLAVREKEASLKA
jgi:hypothetical protein